MIKNKALYLDMDGVVADWNRGAEEFLGVKRPVTDVNPDGRWNHEQWQLIKDNERFFSTLPLMNHAHELVRVARKFRNELGYELLFLTAIPRDNDHPWAFQDKVYWARDYFPDVPVHFGPYSHDKWRHCKPNDILVDDRASNITEWRNHGGIAIRVLNDDLVPAIKELEALYEQHR